MMLVVDTRDSGSGNVIKMHFLSKDYWKSEAAMVGDNGKLCVLAT